MPSIFVIDLMERDQMICILYSCTLCGGRALVGAWMSIDRHHLPLIYCISVLCLFLCMYGREAIT